MKGLNAAPVRVSLPDFPDEWIEIKAALTRGDKDRLDDALVKVVRDDWELKTLSRETLILELAIVGWQLKDEAGKNFEYKHSKIKLLPMNSLLVDKVFEEIVALNPTLTTSDETDTSES